VGSVCPRCRDAAAGWARAASGAGNRWAAVVAAVRRRGGGRSLGGRSLWSVAEAGGKYGRRQAEEAGVTADGRRTGAWSTVGGRRKRRKSRRRRRQAEEAGNYSTADGTQAEEAGVTADGRRTRGGGYGRRQAEEAEVTATAGGRGAPAGNNSTADGRRKRRELRQTAGGADTVGGRQKRRKLRRRQAEEAGNNSTADGRRKRRELRQTAGRRVGNYVRWQAEEAKVTRKLRRHGRRKRGSYGRRIRQGWIYGGRRRWRMIRWAKGGNRWRRWR
jgi:hypothetical protein